MTIEVEVSEGDELNEMYFPRKVCTKILTISEAEGGGERGLVIRLGPGSCGLVVSDAVHPSKRGVSVGIASERALSKDSVGMGHGGVPVGTKLDPRIANGYIYGSRGRADALLLEHALDRIVQRLVPEGILRLSGPFVVVVVAAAVAGRLGLSAAGPALPAAGALPRTRPARAEARSAARSGYAHGFHLAIVVVADLELYLPSFILQKAARPTKRSK